MNLSQAETAYQTLKREILTCALEPGQQVAQAHLANRYKLGATPVREALQRLAQEGYVQPFPRFGYVITPVTGDDVREIYGLRLILEGAAIRLAARHASQEQIDLICHSADFSYVYHDHGSTINFLELNRQFHTAIAQSAGNRRLAEAISRLLDEMARIFHLGLDLRDSAEEMRQEHLALAEALARRDAGQASALIEDQIRCSQERVLNRLAR